MADYTNASTYLSVPIPGVQANDVTEEANQINALDSALEGLLKALGGANANLIVAGGSITAGAGLSVNIVAGTRAIIGGRHVYLVAALNVPALTASQTNYIFLTRPTEPYTQAFTASANITGTPPANSILIASCVCDGSSVTSVNNNPANRTLVSIPYSYLSYVGLTAGHALVASSAIAAAFRALVQADIGGLTTAEKPTFAGITASADVSYSDSAFLIKAATSDGSDNYIVRLCGGGDLQATRGGSVSVMGNEWLANYYGAVYIAAGNPGSAGTFDGAVVIDTPTGKSLMPATDDCTNLGDWARAWKNVYVKTGHYTAGTKVLGAQGAAVADATDAATAITQLNALLARCRTHGIIAT